MIVLQQRTPFCCCGAGVVAAASQRVADTILDAARDSRPSASAACLGRPTPCRHDRIHRIRLVRGISRSRWGYFLRAETMHGLLTCLEENPSWYAAETLYHERSHGQAFNELLATKLGHMTGRGGFLVMDETEAGLSLLSQIALANQLAQLCDDGIQVLLATHG